MDEYLEELTQSEIGVNLHEHQIVGIKGILRWFEEKHGGILADEMGLGKTCQAIGAIVCLISGDRLGHHLIVCPLSVLEHWQNELNRFGLGKIKCIKYTGDAAARKTLQNALKETKNWNVLLTTYEMVIMDANFFNRKWSTLIVDEAHRLKSDKSLLHQIIREMQIEFTLLLTGTPIQNNIYELYSLLALIHTERFPLYDRDRFGEKYRDTSDKKVATELQQLLSTYLIRRTKQILSIDIPNSSEVILYHGITDIQKNLYRAILCKNYRYLEHVNKKNTQTNKLSLLNILMQLRKCVAHPYLFEGVEPEPFEEGEHLIEASGKFFVLDRLLTLLSRRNHRVLIFSQMTRVLDIAQDYLIYKGYNYQRLDGSVRAEERFAAINSFQNNPQTFCFLLSTRAGGLGLNLTAADTVIFLDSDFNPQNDIQAAARCHRIGQTKPVKLIRLIARYTVEEMIQCRASRKMQITEQVLGDSCDSKKNLTAAEISDLIIKGLSHLTNEKTNSNVLTVEAIEELIGKTNENGYWINTEGKHAESSDRSILEARKEDSTTIEHIYIFEGHNYKQDLAVLQDIVNETEASNRNTSSRKTGQGNSSAVLAQKRVRKPLSIKEREERQRKRKEMLEQREEIRKKRRESREQQKKAKIAMMQLKNNYKSGSLPLPESELPDDDSGFNFGPHFVYGSVADTQRAPSDDSDHAIIIHIVDDSGSFGRGGIFDALRKKSQKVVDAYELAGKMCDLHTGDAHIIESIGDELPITPLRQGIHFQNDTDSDDEMPSTSNSSITKPGNWNISVILLVAENRHARDTLDQNVLSQCLKKVSSYAIASGARSVHMPRIGYNKKNISWYAVERVICRNLVSKGIHTYIYYFSRRVNTVMNRSRTDVNTNKRTATTTEMNEANKKKKLKKAGNIIEEEVEQDSDPAFFQSETK